MFLSKPSLKYIVKEQLYYKLKINSGIILFLIPMQLLALFISYQDTHESSFGGIVSIKHYSADPVIQFTLLWAFIIGILVARRGFNTDMFLISTRWVSHLSNILLLLKASIIGGITAILAGVLLRGIASFNYETFFAVDMGALTLLLAMLVTSLYIILLASAGYLAGMLTLVHRSFIIILPVIFFTILFADSPTGVGTFSNDVIEFYLQESSFGMFLIKTLVISAIMWAVTILFSNRLEVE